MPTTSRPISGADMAGSDDPRLNCSENVEMPRSARRHDEGRSCPHGKKRTMRVMVFVKATADSEAEVSGTPEMFEAMGRYNEQLINAGILLAGDGLKPSS